MRKTNPEAETPATRLRCAIYTRKSTEEGLDQEFNTLDAQRDAAEAFIRSQRGEGWSALPEHYDDGGFSGATLERPALHRMLVQGWLAAEWGKTVENHRARYYRLTAAGKKQLKTELGEYRTVARAIARILEPA